MGEGLSDAEWQAIWLSLKVAAVASCASLPLGTALGYALARGTFWGRRLLDGLVHLPLVLPPVVTGYLLLILFSRNGPLGRLLDESFGLVLAFRWTGAALAGALMGLPLMVRAIRLSFETMDRRLEEAAATLGAGPFLRFVFVALPLALPGILAGWVLSFARALGEFGATITFVANIPGETQTIPAAIYAAIQVPGGEAMAFRLSVIAVVIAFAALLVSELLAQRVQARLDG